ncbi:DUF4910 domain-containing protein [Sporomusa aerivorans]|uniref:DUF4910 domain-containing protein n=1 Tax=Sporomusa aerivorans TaxID=204936 RepID=UPI00352B6B0E
MQQHGDDYMGYKMYQLIKALYPICRSITGNGVRESLKIIQQIIPINIFEVPSGTKVFDWTVPKEWNIRDAFIMNEAGIKVIDFQKSNLHVVGYSTPVDKYVSLEELQAHLYSIEDMPDAIPYVTSYYSERWGFCLTQNKRNQLQDGKYQVVIDSNLMDGSLTYGEIIIAGSLEKEIFLSTYICHPSMANNELSGPAVTTLLVDWLLKEKRKYTYRIVFIPETIGSLTYLSKNLETMKRNIIAGFNVTCVGDNRAYSFMPSRYGNTLADKVALNIMKHRCPSFNKYSFLQRGSDERQYCSPGADLPVVSIMRSKYGEYPEYHTSLDNMEFITPEALYDSYALLRSCIEAIENNAKYKVACIGEPQLGKRGLYPNLSTKESGYMVRDMMNFLTYADGTNDLIDISNIIGIPIEALLPIIEKLAANNLIECVD